MGLKFSPVNGSRAVASIFTYSIQIFTLTPQVIYLEYTLNVSDTIYNRNLDISSSGNYAVVAAYS
jgi:hypothetical protein